MKCHAMFCIVVNFDSTYSISTQCNGVESKAEQQKVEKCRKVKSRKVQKKYKVERGNWESSDGQQRHNKPVMQSGTGNCSLKGFP